MTPADDEQTLAITELRNAGTRLDAAESLDDLIEFLGKRPVVLLGEASHGNSEYYQWRSRITAELIRRYNYDFVAVEGDWGPCYHANEYVQGQLEESESPTEAVSEFKRWPTWMWANWEVVDFLEWLHTRNGPAVHPTGFYGLDLYSLFDSMRAVIDYLDENDPEAAHKARDAYNCLESYGESGMKYANALRFAPESCEEEVVEVLLNLREQAWENALIDTEEQLWAEQNARVVKNGESYYRTMVKGGEESWNVRDRHMADTFDRLIEHYGPNARGIVWAHNTHVGDARATNMPEQDRINIGQLLRERHERENVAAVGFGGYEGKVVAGEAWEADQTVMSLPEGRNDSIEGLFHRAGAINRLVFSRDLKTNGPLDRHIDHRAIGVVYNPEVEVGNYVPTVLPERYDAFIHLETVEELHPLEKHPDRQKVPELFPEGV